MKVVVTGAGGLIGWHTAARLHAANCAARALGEEAPHDVVALDRLAFGDDAALGAAVAGADVVLHFAGVNRGSDVDVAAGNRDIALRLAAACQAAGHRAHIVYANSVHAASDTPYGRSKQISGQILAKASGRFTDLILPHVFGEYARPHYNNVTATLIEAALTGAAPQVNPKGHVTLVHAGAVAQAALDVMAAGQTGAVTLSGHQTSVPALWELLQQVHDSYARNIFPDVSDPFRLALFNSYRAALYSTQVLRVLNPNRDARGMLCEAVKSGGGGQTFFSTTKSGITRGNHFHLHKVERFVVLQGEAVIRIRKVLTGQVREFRVSGDQPMAVDMPTYHTHAIENVGSTPLLTLFWTHDLFDPQAPDTFPEPVLKVPS